MVLFVDRLMRPMPVEPLAQHPAQPAPEPMPPVIHSPAGPSGSSSAADDDVGEDEPLLQQMEMAECRICQEEDGIDNLENPCACSGSLKVHFCFFYSVYLQLQVSVRHRDTPNSMSV